MEDITEKFYEVQTDVNLKGSDGLKQWLLCTETNILLAPIFLTQLTLPYISRGGRIVIITSVSARIGMPQQTVYTATKAGLEGICKVWATELEGSVVPQ